MVAVAMSFLIGFTMGVYGTISAYLLGRTWRRLRG